MTAMEIALIVLGLIVFVVSFLIPESTKNPAVEHMDVSMVQKKVEEVVDENLKEVKSQILDVVEETAQYMSEKTERSLERLTNDKISAVSEFSDTVLEDIHKNHTEVLFLYDMLNEKQKELKQLAIDVSKTLTETEQALQELEAKRNHFVPLGVQAIQEVAYEEEPLQDFPQAFEHIGNTKELNVIGDINRTEVTFESEGDQNNNETILTLRREGKSAIAIAKELGLSVGEVKLVLGLFEGV